MRLGLELDMNGNGVSVHSTPAPARLRRKRGETVTLAIGESWNPIRCCHCCRRSLLATSLSGLLPLQPSLASSPTDPTGVMEMVHPSRPDCYEEFYARAMTSGMKAYENEIAGYKMKLFSNLKSGTTRKKILELGVGTGPNFKYYANNINNEIIGVDPNKKMEKYARASAQAAGVPTSDFNFLRAVGEALPVEDNSMDAVVGTLVLCSVKDVNLTLKEVQRILKPGGLYIFIEHVAAEEHDSKSGSKRDSLSGKRLFDDASFYYLGQPIVFCHANGSFLRLLQGVLDPLQQLIADGCHMTRETGKQIAVIGFSDLSLNNAYLKSVDLFGPHVYGVACK